MKLLSVIKKIKYKDFLESLFKRKASNEDDIDNYFRMYGGLFASLLLIYCLVEYFGFTVDKKVTQAIFYNMSGDYASAGRKAMLTAVIIHAVLVVCGGYSFKIKVNGLTKLDEHKPIYYISNTLLLCAFFGTITINIFADSFAKAESRIEKEKMMTELESYHLDNKKVVKNATALYTAASNRIFTSKSKDFTTDSSAITAIHNGIVKATKAKAQKDFDRYDEENKSTYYFGRRAELTMSDTLKSYQDMITKIAAAKSNYINAAKTDASAVKKENAKVWRTDSTLLAQKMALKQETLEDMESNEYRAGWFLRVQSTLFQVLSLVVSLGLQMLYKFGNETKETTTHDLETKAEQAVLQALTTGKSGVLKLERGFKAKCRNWFKRGKSNTVSDNWLLFQYSEGFLKRAGITVKTTSDGKSIEFFDSNGSKI